MDGNCVTASIRTVGGLAHRIRMRSVLCSCLIDLGCAALGKETSEAIAECVLEKALVAGRAARPDVSLGAALVARHVAAQAPALLAL